MYNRKDEDKDKDKRVLQIQIDKNSKHFDKLDELCLKAKNIYNTTLYYAKNHYIGTRNIYDGKENHENVVNIVNEFHAWIKAYNERIHNNNINIINYMNELYSIPKISLEVNTIKEYKELINNYKKTLKEHNVKVKKNDKLLYVLNVSKSWYGEILTNDILQKYMKNKEEYQALYVDTADTVIKDTVKTWTTYFKQLTDFTKHPSKYKGKPCMPNYKPRGDIGRSVCAIRKCYSIEPIDKDNEYCMLKLDKSDFSNSGIEFKVPLKNKLDMSLEQPIAQIRIIPNKDKYPTMYCIELVYKPLEEKHTNNGDGIAAIDIGVDRLATVCNNKGLKPFAINGQPLKSVNKHWNKENAKYKSILETVNNKKTSNRLDRLSTYRHNYIHTYMHKASTMIVNWCIENNISKVVIGKNKGWKQNSNMGKIQNQTFVQIPFAKFISMLEYKCKDKGIETILQEESYTSKASFIDNEVIKTYGKDDEDITYKKRRIHRGLYVSDNNVNIHADLNGAYNILRKYDNNFTYNNDYLHPVIKNVG